MYHRDRKITKMMQCGYDEFEYRKKMWHKKREKEIRREKRILAGCIAVFAAIVIIFIGGLRSEISASETGNVPRSRFYTNVTVQRGDTLWSIAKAYTDGSNAETRQLVDEIREINKIAFYEPIRSGDRLIIPYTSYDQILTSAQGKIAF